MARQIRENARGSKKRTPYPVVIIVCDAEKTEPRYFSHFKRRDKPLRIEVVKDASGKDYNAVIRSAIDAKDKHIAGTESSWAVWCVSDVDVDINTPGNQSVRNNQLKEYVKKAKYNGFKIALSNPCFELWYLLHFAYTTEPKRNYDAVIKKLAKHVPNYKKTNDVYGLLADKQAAAITHAKRLNSYHDEQGKTDFMDVSVNPYTNVWDLVELLI